MEKDYREGRHHWGCIVLGREYLFVKGHLPIPYERIGHVEYDVQEERVTTSTTIPESLRFHVYPEGDAEVIVHTIPCPME